MSEPLCTLIRTLSISILEVRLISAAMLGGSKAPTLGRGTMFAVLMIVLNGAVGLGLLIGLLTEQTVVLGLSGANMVLLAVTLLLNIITFSNARTTMLEGAVPLTLFGAFIVLVVSP